MATAVDVVNAVISTSTTLKENIPLATAATLQATGGAIMSYTPYMNEFISGLVNRILFQEAHNVVYENPLRVFKGVDVPYGTDVQDSIANPAIATPYDSTAMSDVLSPANPDVKTVYYRRNRQDKYKVTVYDEQLTGAFLNAETFNNFVSMILNTLTSGDNIDEFKLMKGLSFSVKISKFHLSFLLRSAIPPTLSRSYINVYESIINAYAISVMVSLIEIVVNVNRLNITDYNIRGISVRVL